jgi:hypothetical protein
MPCQCCICVIFFVSSSGELQSHRLQSLSNSLRYGRSKTCYDLSSVRHLHFSDMRVPSFQRMSHPHLYITHTHKHAHWWVWGCGGMQVQKLGRSAGNYATETQCAMQFSFPQLKKCASSSRFVLKCTKQKNINLNAHAHTRTHTGTL